MTDQSKIDFLMGLILVTNNPEITSIIEKQEESKKELTFKVYDPAKTGGKISSHMTYNVKVCIRWLAQGIANSILLGEPF